MTYKFTNLPNIQKLQEDCEVHLTTTLPKYDPQKNSKAFAYFTVVAKNFFIHKVKQNAKQQKRESAFEEISKQIEMERLSVENEYDSIRDQYEFFEYLIEEMEKWEKTELKENEKKVLFAIRQLLNDPPDEQTKSYNKKAIYYYVREITKLNTKQVLNSLKPFRQSYLEFKKKWNNGEL